MCLYTKFIRNKRYTANKKNSYKPPICEDRRLLYVPVKCEECIECRKDKQREWQVRLTEEMKDDNSGKFVTLSFSEESLTKLEKKYNTKEANTIAAKAVREFTERWRAKHKKAPKHWLITELGHNNTERLHLHGIIYTNENNREIEERWGNGNIYVGYSMTLRTINYIIKYITKPDRDHPGFKSKILASKGIGKRYINSWDFKNNEYKENGDTNETYRLPSGAKIALPMYYRNKRYSEDQKQKLWLQKLEKGSAFVRGQEIKKTYTQEGAIELENALKQARRINKELGYGDGKTIKKEYMTKNGKIVTK
ncbi:replication initiation protein [Tortoise microvirus 18]|nr:replication initiation protein [Tortoise microvirus 18]